jgi:lysyl-tRNA synthetase class I
LIENRNKSSPFGIQNYKKFPNNKIKTSVNVKILQILEQYLQILKQASNSSPPIKKQRFFEISSMESVKIIQLFRVTYKFLRLAFAQGFGQKPEKPFLGLAKRAEHDYFSLEALSEPLCQVLYSCL